MLNCVNLVATLKEVDDKDPFIRYCLVSKPYDIKNAQEDCCIVPLINWNKNKYGELFALKDNSLVAIKGRVELYKEKVIILVETITLLNSPRFEIS